MDIKKISFAICPLFAFYFSQNIIAENLSKNETFHNLKSIEIDNSLGDIIILPSNDKEGNTFIHLEGEGVNEISLFHNGDELLIKKLESNKVLYHQSKRVDIIIHAAPTVKNFACNIGEGNFSVERFNGNLNFNSGSSNVSIKDIVGEVSLNTGDSKIDIENIKGNISLNAGTLKNGKITNVVGNVDINAGNSLDFSFLDVFGDISINGASGTFVYTASKKTEFPINIKANGASFDFILNLSSEFKSISNKVRGLNVISSFLPVTPDNGDINFKGDFARGTLNVKQIKNKNTSINC